MLAAPRPPAPSCWRARSQSRGCDNVIPDSTPSRPNQEAIAHLPWLALPASNACLRACSKTAHPALYRTGGQKACGLQPGDDGALRWQGETTRAPLCASETATLAGQTRSPAHTPTPRVLAAPGPAAERQGATAAGCGLARPVDGPLEAAQRLGSAAVQRGSRRRPSLRGSGSDSPAFRRGRLKIRHTA